MINQLLAVGFGVPVTYFFLTLAALILFKNVRGAINTLFKDITIEWATFMGRGIPIPADYKRIETPLTAKAILTQPVYQAPAANKTALVNK